MGAVISRLIKKRFVYNVPIQMHRDFLRPFASSISLDLEMTDHDELYAYFIERGEELPPEVVYNLQRISDMACPEGYDLLITKAKELDTQILPLEEDRNPSDLDQNEIAFLAYLHYPAVFEEASRNFHQASIKSYAEFNGVEELDIDEDEEKEETFKQAVEDYFNERYKGRWCEVLRHVEGGAIHYIISHGKFKKSIRVVEDGGPNIRAFREEKQDVVIYYPFQGKLLVSATTAEEKSTLAKMFAKIVLSHERFFDHDGANNNYTIEPLRVHGLDFKFDYDWDADILGISITEIQFSDEERGSEAISFRSGDVLRQLADHPEIDIQKNPIKSIKIKFQFLWNGKRKSRTVVIKPPVAALFDRRLFGEKILTHLQRNHFIYDRQAS